MSGARTLAAFLLAAAPALAQELGSPPVSGGPPSLRIHGRKVETRDQSYSGERALATLDVSSADYRPDLASLGKRSGPARVDPVELRARTLALYGGDAGATRPADGATAAPRKPPAQPQSDGSGDEGNLALALGGIAALLVIGAGVFLLRRRGALLRSPASPDRTDDAAPQ